MSTRKLVQRSRQLEGSSPAPRARQRNSHAAPDRRDASSIAQLPPYEMPSCPLTADARLELDNLRVNHDYSKYSRHLKAAKGNLTNTAADAHDRLRLRREEVEKQSDKRRKNGSNEKSQPEKAAEEQAHVLEAKVIELTKRAEIAMREMIDYGDELAMDDTIMKDVSENIPPLPSQQPARQQRHQAASDDEENGSPTVGEEELRMEIPDAPLVSPIELLRQANEEYSNNYTSKSMRARYENTDYATFKRTIHESQHGQDGPPVPHARTWFTEDDGHSASGANRRRTNINNDDGSDDDIVIARASTNLKCPLTLQYFREPYSNHVCKHSFEKSAILEYHRNEAVAYPEPVQRGRNRQPSGPKAVKCPQTGCDAMLKLDDFFDDTALLRQVKRAQKEAAREEYDDEDEDDDAPRGTQMSRPENVDSEMSFNEEEAEQRHRDIARVKRERAQSRGLSLAPSQR